jgi:hypothetical protein
VDIGSNRPRLIKCAATDEEHLRTPILAEERDLAIGTAEDPLPAAIIARNADRLRLSCQNLDVAGLDQQVDHERAARLPLTALAVAAVDEERLRRQAVAHAAARASAFPLPGHCRKQSKRRDSASLQTSSSEGTSGAWDPNTRLLTIVANGDGGQTAVPAGDSLAFSGKDITEWQGAMYGGAYRVQLNAGIKAAGPIIADEVVLNATVQEQGFSTLSEVPTGMPGNLLVAAQPDSPELYSG